MTASARSTSRRARCVGSSRPTVRCDTPPPSPTPKCSLLAMMATHTPSTRRPVSRCGKHASPPNIDYCPATAGSSRHGPPDPAFSSTETRSSPPPGCIRRKASFCIVFLPRRESSNGSAAANSRYKVICSPETMSCSHRPVGQRRRSSAVMTEARWDGTRAQPVPTPSPPTTNYSPVPATMARSPWPTSRAGNRSFPSRQSRFVLRPT